MRVPPSRWRRYADAAVRSPARKGNDDPVAAGRIREALEPARDTASRQCQIARRRRTDLRLVFPALLVWGTAGAGNWLPPAGLAGLCTALAAAAGIMLFLPGRVNLGRSGIRPARKRRARIGRGGAGLGPSAGRAAPRSLRATVAVALLLSLAAAAHAAVEASQRHDGAIAEAVAAGAAVVAELEIAGAPRRLRIPGAGGLADRWAVPVKLTAMTFGGHRVAGDARLVVMGGASWGDAVPGQHLRATGKLRPAAPGQPEAGLLAATSAPTLLRGPGPWQQGPGELRRAFTAAAARFGGDAGGLLPGMVTGDTSALDAELEAAMKTVGMTHLTAVSGANCSLILGTLLLTARTLRLPRTAAAGASLAGLALFVLMVGPDPSVLRASLMGSIGLASVAFGRAGRGLSLLCVAVIGLLVAQPVLATSFGFLLSVLATLGIVVTGRRIMDWLPPSVPRWAAAGVAVPLSAQLFCAPAIVLLQPQFGAYALPANMAAAALVAPVTLLGTAGAALLPAVPAAAGLLMAPAAVFAGAVAGVARLFAALPGAVLPWPEGAFGVATMGLFSATVLAAAWLALHPAAVVRGVLAAHARVVAVLDGRSQAAARSAARQTFSRGLDHRSGRGTLRVRKPTSGRNHEWLLPRPNGPGPRRRTPPPGAT
ncbi:ComEC/Rec2 family competence protein [Arthrobacter sp. 9MFCol3.1]|uniref:ComEC/Rec2 family competence protein n=1 Tax=Arthrobacter sp. 9MFCol3.1 TaxID=1150398 RepID=UPI001E58FC23|nr:ComEC/Rec2 family competence protein [Arthrobacter sp. 9MFCol3.1]